MIISKFDGWALIGAWAVIGMNRVHEADGLVHIAVNPFITDFRRELQTDYTM